jgi:hypothetical protein
MKMNKNQRKVCDMAVVDWIGLDLLPFNAISGMGFRLLVREFSHARYELPCRNTIVKLCKERGAELRAEFSKKYIVGETFLKGSISLTFDSWSARDKTRIVGTTGHAISDEWEVISFPIAFVPHQEVLGPLSADRVSALIDLELKTMEITDIFSATCDGGGNMENAVEQLHPKLIGRCVSHRLN